MPRSAASERIRLADQAHAADLAVAGRVSDDPRQKWLKAFRTVRAETERRAAPLSLEDQVVQSMPDASPTKWHRAHVTWFFEQFLLRPFAKGYRPFDERFAYLYNSYYVSAGPRQARPQRGLITRPSAAEIGAYRAHVDEAVAELIEAAKDMGQLIPIIEIGLHHEQQHQELLLTDILHAFSLSRRTRPTIRIGIGRPATANAPTPVPPSPASIWSGTAATASASTTSSRRIRRCCVGCGWHHRL